MKTSALIMILSVCFCIASAQNTPEEIAKEFFNLVGQKKYTEAIDKLPASAQLINDTAFNTKLKAKLNSLESRNGEYCGYELIEKDEVSPSYLVYTYFIKYTEQPHRIQFIFYKPKDRWQVIQVILNVQTRAVAEGKKQSMRKPVRQP
jgi:hypothetical protein